MKCGYIFPVIYKLLFNCNKFILKNCSCRSMIREFLICHWTCANTFSKFQNIQWISFICVKTLHLHLIKSLKRCLETYCFCSVSSYYYYVTPTAVWWRIAILRFFFTIIIIIIPHIFVRSISRRCLDHTLWNLVGISYAMWSCASKGWFFQNGCRCHGNGQNANKLKNTKMIIAGYSPNRNWWNLIETTSTSSGTR